MALPDSSSTPNTAHLIFQGWRFPDQALDFRLSIAVPLARAGDSGASRHASIHYGVRDLDGDDHRFVVDAFCNTRSLFVCSLRSE